MPPARLAVQPRPGTHGSQVDRGAKWHSRALSGGADHGFGLWTKPRPQQSACVCPKFPGDCSHAPFCLAWALPALWLGPSEGSRLWQGVSEKASVALGGRVSDHGGDLRGRVRAPGTLLLRVGPGGRGVCGSPPFLRRSTGPANAVPNTHVSHLSFPLACQGHSEGSEVQTRKGWPPEAHLASPCPPLWA